MNRGQIGLGLGLSGPCAGGESRAPATMNRGAWARERLKDDGMRSSSGKHGRKNLRIFQGMSFQAGGLLEPIGIESQVLVGARSPRPRDTPTGAAGARSPRPYKAQAAYSDGLLAGRPSHATCYEALRSLQVLVAAPACVQRAPGQKPLLPGSECQENPPQVLAVRLLRAAHRGTSSRYLVPLGCAFGAWAPAILHAPCWRAEP